MEWSFGSSPSTTTAILNKKVYLEILKNEKRGSPNDPIPSPLQYEYKKVGLNILKIIKIL